jgi:hypothetical protein
MSGGSAAFTTSTLTVGNHSILARYNGDANFNGSKSNSLVQTVLAATASTVLLSGKSSGQDINRVLPALTRIVVTVPTASSVSTPPSALNSLSSLSVASLMQDPASGQGILNRGLDANLKSNAPAGVDRTIVDQIFSVL